MDTELVKDKLRTACLDAWSKGIKIQPGWFGSPEEGRVCLIGAMVMDVPKDTQVPSKRIPIAAARLGITERQVIDIAAGFDDVVFTDYQFDNAARQIGVDIRQEIAAGTI